ncbi:putative U-box domain-containing protein 55 [Panicum miliaceum]|uniref:U-box domain-containing protein 55 n=1 Tax=Panicum miliaceum TaxID=4540 RepID=A0A3L6RAC4_PANMI|nr:putative U-box domain-containing protein 55 [Panicum miliaceum]
MRDPHIAADEISYEGSEIRKWIDAGKHNSPMKNESLTHDVLIRNTALRRAIEDWQKQQLQLQLQQASSSGAGDDDRSH